MKIKLLEVSLKKNEKLFLGNKFCVIKKGSVLLKINSDSNGVVEKKNVSYENLNMSKTQYYSILMLVKKENLLKEEKKRIILNLKKIDEKLNSDNFLEKCI